MMTPYDWQEAISHRAQFVESRLTAGVPVVAVSLPAGILAATFRRQSRKLFELYDRLMFAGIGQQSDVENLRVAAIEFAHQEGFQRSENDVTVQRVVSVLSQPIKKAFADFSSPPFVGRALFCELGGTPSTDHYYVVDYDGDYAEEQAAACVAGSAEATEAILRVVRANDFSESTPEEATPILVEAVRQGIDPEGNLSFGEVTDGLTSEVALLRRDAATDRRFRLLTG